MSKNNGMSNNGRLRPEAESSSNLTYWELLEWLKRQPPSVLRSQDVVIMDAFTDEFIVVTRYDKTLNSHGVLRDPHLILVTNDELGELNA